MATPNYGYEKRQKELAKKKKKEEKLKHKAERKVGEGVDDAAPEENDTTDAAEPGSDVPAQP
ncbi:hypothetical protein [Rhodoferax sp.]|uniref:hypothetical protein n=1 Tax=Rhodoferax sp. TaxID=50421 RepID=UPI001ED35C23|nr:hypothetical protein [Rhodoferax sp.]MBT9506938.1 hypothetical protein [Rhodoferax sp.]